VSIGDADRLALRFAAEVDAAERGLLSCGFHDPVALYNAAFKWQLSEEHFTDVNHAAIFRAILAHAELHVTPTVRTVRLVAESVGAVFIDTVPDAVTRIVFTEGAAGLVDYYCGLVVEAKRRRDRVREITREAAELLDPDRTSRQAPVAPAPKRAAVEVPRRIRQSARRRSYAVAV